MTKPRKQRATTSANIDTSKPAAMIVNDRFQGLSNFCALTGYATSTVFRWLERGYIPAEFRTRPGISVHAHIMAVAEASNIAISPADFVLQAPAPHG